MPEGQRPPTERQLKTQAGAKTLGHPPPHPVSGAAGPGPNQTKDQAKGGADMGASPAWQLAAQHAWEPSAGEGTAHTRRAGPHWKELGATEMRPSREGLRAEQTRTHVHRLESGLRQRVRVPSPHVSS